jgi:hypothetical protein
MGNTFILVGAAALGTGLVSLFCGYFWGRSNVRSQIEDALDKARRSADAREFFVREELDEKMVELTELRARVEEVPQLREQLEKLKSERAQGSALGRVFAYSSESDMPMEQALPQKAQPPAPVPDSADKAIQKLLKSIEERMNEAEENPRVVVQENAKPSATRFAVEIPPAVTQLTPRPAPAQVPVARPTPAAAKPTPAVARPTPAAKDEWQEFAASLAALKNRQK